MAIVFIVILSLFILFFITVMVINTLRLKKTNERLKTNKGVLEGIIEKVVTDDKNITMLVGFKSPTSLQGFNKRFVLSRKNHLPENYKEGQAIRLQYPKYDEAEKVLFFPIYLDGEKPQFNANFLYGSLALTVATVALLVYMIFYFIQKDAFNKNINDFFNLFNSFYIMFLSLGYVIAINAMVTILITPSQESFHDYLKVYGIKATARVKTYKFGRSKDSHGNKECYLQIEYTTTTGEKVETRLSSFLYFQNQDEFIDILYTPNNTRNVVFFRRK